MHRNCVEEELELIARKVRRIIVEAGCRSRSPHIGSSLSCVDLLVALYFREMRIDVANWNQRDIFVLSKAHAALALYAVLTVKEIIDIKSVEGYFQNDGTLPGHLDKFTARGVEVSTGSLGHGFNVALGMAYGHKLKQDTRKFYVLIGDGESQEGSVWEGALFASRLKIDNITAIIDYNNLQGYGRPTEICYFEPVVEKWKAFGWEAYRVNGHDFSDILSAFGKPHNGKPKIIVAETVKGKGIPFMEDDQKWHYYIVTDEVKNRALECLQNAANEKYGRQ